MSSLACSATKQSWRCVHFLDSLLIYNNVKNANPIKSLVVRPTQSLIRIVGARYRGATITKIIIISGQQHLPGEIASEVFEAYSIVQ